MVLGSLKMWNMVLFLGIASRVGESLHLELQSGRTKCISEDIKSNSMSVGKYSVVNHNEAHPSHKISIRVTSGYGNTYHHAVDVDSGQFAFTAVEAADYTACFTAANHKPELTLSIDFDWRTGVHSKSWTSLAKKSQVQVMEFEVKSLIETVNSINQEMYYLRDREEEMQNLNRATNSNMACFTFLSLFVCLGVAAMQFWHLKAFLEKKKVI